ncbi:MAG: phosphoenolpyruvate mutase [Longicatena caecimuris]|uniref:phosphoenolpyruvate mutase n=1 Tax=Longicatena caecimuris TaxID=1796635 RepID=UPI003994E2BB
MKSVYACFSTDVIHEGHLHIIQEAQAYGELTIGVLTDEALIKFDRFPTITFDERFQMMQKLDGVAHVVAQSTVSYTENLQKLKPDYVIHGDNWKTNEQKIIRDNVLKVLSTWGGQLIEVPYTRTEKVQHIDKVMHDKLAMPEFRRKRLRQLLQLRPIVKALEVHSGITALIAEKTIVQNKEELDQFDAMWISSLCDSTAKGKPDIELVDMSSRIRTIDDVMDVSTKPIILDGDTGGLIEHFVYNVRTLERLGVSAIIIEDKTGLKKNSLFGNDVEQTQDSIAHFCEKIKAGKQAQLSEDFMIIARIESLILEKGIADALQRAYAYVAAGADGIMIHSRQKTPDEIFAFCDAFRQKDKNTPIVVVPTSYHSVLEEQLAAHVSTSLSMPIS